MINSQLSGNIADIKKFLNSPRVRHENPLAAISIFSGGGVSDVGYEQAGFRFYEQAELDPHRVAMCRSNFPDSCVEQGPIADTWGSITKRFRNRENNTLDLLSITPPCQGMSSSNPGRGKATDSDVRDKRNRLLLDAIPLIEDLKPRILVAENVAMVLKEVINVRGKSLRIVEAFQEDLKEYQLFAGVVQMADYGIPQMRRRAILVGIRRDEKCLSLLNSQGRVPWPKTTHSEKPTDGVHPWLPIASWFDEMKYEALDAGSKETARSATDPLHFVPFYEGDRYNLVADIPARSGRNAYENSNCRMCGRKDVPAWTTHCPYCNQPMRNRPYVEENGEFRLIKGFNSSYRRMHPDRPAPTVMTNSSHVGSDYKIHPWENRVLSIRECADLQTIPRFYDWSWGLKTRHTYVARGVIGEALPPWFTFLHGGVLFDLLNGIVKPNELAPHVVGTELLA